MKKRYIVLSLSFGILFIMTFFSDDAVLGSIPVAQVVAPGLKPPVPEKAPNDIIIKRKSEHRKKAEQNFSELKDLAADLNKQLKEADSIADEKKEVWQDRLDKAVNDVEKAFEKFDKAFSEHAVSVAETDIEQALHELNRVCGFIQGQLENVG